MLELRRRQEEQLVYRETSRTHEANSSRTTSRLGTGEMTSSWSRPPASSHMNRPSTEW